MFLHLWAPRHVRQARAEARDKDNPEKLRLSLQRMDNDPPVLYEVLTVLDMLGHTPVNFYERPSQPLCDGAFEDLTEHFVEHFAQGPTVPDHPLLKEMLP
jgi:hypothetical protein